MRFRASYVLDSLKYKKVTYYRRFAAGDEIPLHNVFWTEFIINVVALGILIVLWKRTYRIHCQKKRPRFPSNNVALFYTQIKMSVSFQNAALIRNVAITEPKLK